jgi:transcriptional regulator with XRE-family HTH domain
MSGQQLRAAREALGMTQQQAARRWRVSQPYLSLVENDRRRMPVRLARLLARQERAVATALPFEVPTDADLPRLLGTLGYPGFAYLADLDDVTNPAGVVVAALRHANVPARVTEALPWLLTRFAHLDWDWLVNEAKRWNVQNRLGYLVSLAMEVAKRRSDSAAVPRLERVEQQLEDARLAKEDSLGRTLTEAERRYLREHRPPAAAHWNLLTSLRADDLRYAV